MMGISEALLVAVSLCADCFAVSLCSSVTLKKIDWRNVTIVALSFAAIQAGLLWAGWAFGSLFVGFLSRISHILGFLLLMYVGIGMLVEGLEGADEVKDLNGFRNIVMGGIATSIDALAVGVAQSMGGVSTSDIVPLIVSVFSVTAISVVCGICGGHVLGKKIGRWAEIIGGIVLICIGVNLLL